MSDKIHVVCGHCDAVVALLPQRIADAPRCPTCKSPLFGPKPLELTAANFGKHVARNDLPVVVDFWAPWCGPCLAMAPHYEKVAAQLGGRLRFAKLNAQDEPGPGEQFGIRSIPTLIVFRAGAPVARQSGALDANALRQWLDGLAP